MSFLAEVSGVALGKVLVDFAEPNVPLVAAWSSGLNVTCLGSVQAKDSRKRMSKAGFIKSLLQRLCYHKADFID